MIEWFDPEKHLPEDGEQCLLMPHENNRLVTTQVYGPIQYEQETKAWVDLFSSQEAGTIIAVKDVGCWTLWGPIAPPEGLPTPIP